VSGKTEVDGDVIFHNEDPHTVQSVKKSLRAATEDMAANLDSETQELVVNEGIKVFELNNTLINSVEGVNEAFGKLVRRMALVALLILAVLFGATKVLKGIF